MTTDLTVRDTGALVASMYSGVEIPAEQRTTPRITLLQSNSKEVTENGEKLGTYHCTEFSDNFGEVLKFIPVKPFFGAVYLELKRGLVCKTLDGQTSIKGDTCRNCPHNEYHLNWKIKGVQPKCQSNIEFIGIEGTTGQPCIVSFKSKSYKAGLQIVKAINNAMRRGDNTLYMYNLGSARQTNDSGSFFVSQLVGKPQVVEDPQLVNAVSACVKMLDAIQNAMNTEVDHGDTGSVD